jgi:hypothetical protein
MGDLYDNFEVGQRVQLVSLNDAWSDLKPGDRGAVIHPTLRSAGGEVTVRDYRVCDYCGQPIHYEAITFVHDGDGAEACRPEDSLSTIATPKVTGSLSDYRIVSIKWDSGSWLMLVPEAGDACRLLTDEEVIEEETAAEAAAAAAEAAKAAESEPV